MKFCYNTNFTIPKQSQRSRSILQDGSRSLELFWKEKKTPSYKKYDTHRGTYHYVVQSQESPLSKGFDKIFCLLASENIRKQKDLIQLMKSLISNGDNTIFMLGLNCRQWTILIMQFNIHVFTSLHIIN